MHGKGEDGPPKHERAALFWVCVMYLIVGVASIVVSADANRFVSDVEGLLYFYFLSKSGA